MNRYLALVFAVVGVSCAAWQTLTPEDRSRIAYDAAKIEGCQERGRACQSDGGAECYSVYDACMRDAGFR